MIKIPRIWHPAIAAACIAVYNVSFAIISPHPFFIAIAAASAAGTLIAIVCAVALHKRLHPAD